MTAASSPALAATSLAPPTPARRRARLLRVLERLGRSVPMPSLAVAGSLAALLAAVASLPLLTEARLAVFDAYQRASPRPYQPAPVRVVDIDEASLAIFGQWPWPRRLLARLVDRLTEAGAAAIVFDIAFAEPDRSSPANLLASLDDDPALRELARSLGSLPDYDQELAAAFGRSRVVTGFALTTEANAVRPAVKASTGVVGPDPTGFLRSFAGAVANLPQLEAAAHGNGYFSIVAGHDDTVRHVPLVLALDGRLYPSLAVEALRVAQGADTIKLRTGNTGGGAGGLERLRVGELDLPVSAAGEMWLHYSKAVPERTIAAGALLEDGPLPGDVARRVAGNIVLIGTSAAGLKDLRATPLDPFEAGVVVHAQLLEQILLGWRLTRPAWGQGAELLAAWLAGLLLLAATTRLGARWSAGIALAAAIAIGAASWLAFTGLGLLLDPVLVVLAILGTYLAGSLLRYMRVEREKGQMRRAFGHYLAPALVERLAREPESLKLGGETRELTFLFSDIAGFTSFAEQVPPATLVASLNAYLDGLCEIVMEHGGTIDKIVGDAVHAMFNAPVDQPDHPARAVACALAMDAFAARFSDEQGGRGIPFGATRIGINTGPAVVGNFGGTRRFDYTAHGDAINTTARLESVNSFLGTRICVAAATVARCPAHIFRPVGTLMLKGKEIGVKAFEPLGTAVRPSAMIGAYSEAFAYLDVGDVRSSDLFSALQERYPEDPLIALHARRTAGGETGTRIVIAGK